MARHKKFNPDVGYDPMMTPSDTRYLEVGAPMNTYEYAMLYAIAKSLDVSFSQAVREAIKFTHDHNKHVVKTAAIKA